MKSPTGKGDKAEDCACCQQQVGDHWPSWRIWTFNYGKRLNPCRLFYLRVGNDGAFLQSSKDWPRSGISKYSCGVEFTSEDAQRPTLPHPRPCWSVLTKVGL